MKGIKFKMSLDDKIIKAVNEEKIDIIVECLKEFKKYDYKRKSFYWNNSKMTPVQKFKFLYFSYKTERDQTFDFELFYEFFLVSLLKDKNKDLLNALEVDNELQRMFAKYIKGIKPNFDMLDEELPEILKLPAIKEEILNDDIFVSENFSRNYVFFDNLPQEYSYLISIYYKYRKDKEENINDIKRLYEKYYNGILSQEEQEELSVLQYEINNSANILKVDNKTRIYGIEFVLRKLGEDKEFYKKVKVLQGNLEIDLNVLLKFISKYSDTEMFEQLLQGSKITDENILKKIIFLAKNSPIGNIKTLEQLSIISSNDLQEMCFDNDGNTGSNLIGGPSSITLNRVFYDSEPREIRRIDPNGRDIIYPLFKGELHIEGLETMYKDLISFPDQYSTVFEITQEAAKRLFSITFVIENEQCCIYMPMKITEEQKKIVQNWINNTTEYGKLGIMLYNNSTGDNILVNEGEVLTKEDVLEFICNMAIREEKKTIDMDRLCEDMSNLYESEIKGIEETGKKINGDLEKEKPLTLK